jgi:hypothetical protein
LVASARQCAVRVAGQTTMEGRFAGGEVAPPVAAAAGAVAVAVATATAAAATAAAAASATAAAPETLARARASRSSLVRGGGPPSQTRSRRAAVKRAHVDHESRGSASKHFSERLPVRAPIGTLGGSNNGPSGSVNATSVATMIMFEHRGYPQGPSMLR